MEEEEGLHAGVVQLSLAHDAENLMLLTGGPLDLEGAGAELEVVRCSCRSGPALDSRRGPDSFEQMLTQEPQLGVEAPLSFGGQALGAALFQEALPAAQPANKSGDCRGIV